MRMRKNKHCILAMIVLILITVSNCSTTPAKTEVVDPALTFPFFPDPLDGDGKPILSQIDGNVILPMWYWLKIVEYVVDTKATQETYEAWKKVYLPLPAEEK